MRRTRREFSREYKHAALRFLGESSYSLAQVERELGLNHRGQTLFAYGTHGDLCLGWLNDRITDPHARAGQPVSAEENKGW